MISIKSDREIKLMKEAGRIVALAHRKVREAIKPGVSTLELDRIAYEAIIGEGATPSFKGYGGFPASICASINDEVIHGIPKNNRILKNGDIISIDIGACYLGYHGDSAMTHGVGEISLLNKRLIEETKNALFKALEQAKPNNRLSDISNTVQKHVEACGFSVVREFTGHGIGKKLHEDPAIPNYGEPGCGPLLRKGMTLAVEPMVNAGKQFVKILDDNWTTVTADNSYSAHFEHTIVITEDGYKILSIEEDN